MQRRVVAVRQSELQGWNSRGSSRQNGAIHHVSRRSAYGRATQGSKRLPLLGSASRQQNRPAPVGVGPRAERGRKEKHPWHENRQRQPLSPAGNGNDAPRLGDRGAFFWVSAGSQQASCSNSRTGSGEAGRPAGRHHF